MSNWSRGNGPSEKAEGKLAAWCLVARLRQCSQTLLRNLAQVLGTRPGEVKGPLGRYEYKAAAYRHCGRKEIRRVEHGLISRIELQSKCPPCQSAVSRHQATYSPPAQATLFQIKLRCLCGRNGLRANAAGDKTRRERKEEKK